MAGIGASQSGIVKAELPFCPYCDHRLRKREYPRLIRRLFFLAPEYRWQCESCGYAERSRSRLPFNLAISGAFLVLASLSLYISEEELVDYRAIIRQVRDGALYAGLAFLGLGFLVFIVRQFFAEPVFKRLCQQCEVAFVCNQAWSNLDFCSVECVALAASASAEEELAPEEVEEVEDDDEDIEDVDDALVEDDVDDDTEAEAEAAIKQAEAKAAAEEAEAEAAIKQDDIPTAELDAPIIRRPSATEAPAPVAAASGGAAVKRDSGVGDDEQVAEMVLFDDEDAGSGAWDSAEILNEIDEVEDKELDALVELENSDELAASETVEAELSLFDTRRFNQARDMSGEWDVNEILAESEDLEENEDLTKSVRLRPSELARPNIEEAVPAEESDVREAE